MSPGAKPAPAKKPSSTACPVGIDTGDLTRRLRGRKIAGGARRIGEWTANHFGTLANVSRLGLKAGHLASGIVGDNFLGRISGGAWKKRMPHAGKAAAPRSAQGDPVVYFPACGGRIFGPSEAGEAQLGDVIMTLLTRAGYAPRLPQDFWSALTSTWTRHCALRSDYARRMALVEIDVLVAQALGMTLEELLLFLGKAAKGESR